MSETDYILSLVKYCWPQFDISKEDLLHPTVQFVVRFYSDFINDVNHKIAYLSGSQDNFNKIDFASKEQLFQEVSRLLKNIFKLKFMLGDIYQPTPIRTRIFFKTCIHFIAFMNQSLNEIDALGRDMFKKKEEVNKLLVEQEELLHEINENGKVKTEMLESNKMLQEEYKSTEKSYKEMMAQRTAKEKMFAEKRHEIGSLNYDVWNREYELNHLEPIKKGLLEKTVTNEEYNNILHTLETLTSESETLNCSDVIIEDVLVNENKVLKHCNDCIKELDKCCDANLHQNVKKLMDLEEELKIASNTYEKLRMNKLNLLIQTKLESEKHLAATKDSLSNLRSEYKEVVEYHENTLKQFSQDMEMARKRLEEEFQNNLQIISNYNKTNKNLEEYMDKLKKTVSHEYYKVSKAEKRIIDIFKNTLEKYGNLL